APAFFSHRDCAPVPTRGPARASRMAPVVTPVFWLGRQPILDAMADTIGYELLFRSSDANAANVADNCSATASVINYAFSELGIASVLGDHRGYINFDSQLLMSDVVELLPPERTVIELLELVEVT